MHKGDWAWYNPGSGLGKTICTLSKNEFKQHWMIKGDFKYYTNQGMFGYFEHYKEKETIALNKLKIEDIKIIEKAINT